MMYCDPKNPDMTVLFMMYCDPKNPDMVVLLMMHCDEFVMQVATPSNSTAQSTFTLIYDRYSHYHTQVYSNIKYHYHTHLHSNIKYHYITTRTCIVILNIIITHLDSYSPVMGLHSIVRYDKKIIINNRPIWSDYGVSIISKWALNNRPVWSSVDGLSPDNFG